MADYCRMSIVEIEELDIVEYLCYYRDARIYQLSQTEDGREYLANAWRIRQTAPERSALRDKFGKQKENP